MRNAEVTRQWQVLREIETRRTGVTIYELADLVKVSTRTIRRDLQALQEAGFAIYDEGETNETKKWRLDAAPFRVVQGGLSVSDVAALYLSRAVVEGLSGWLLADELRAAFEKLDQALNPRMREFLATLPSVISAKAGPRAPSHSVRQVHMTRKLFDAARDRQVVEMKYFSATANRAKTYLVEPYRLALAQGGLYLVAWVPAYDAFRTFATERIERLSVTETLFKRTRDLPARLFESSMGVFTGEPERIEVTFAASIATFVRSRIWHASQELTDLPNGGVHMTLAVSNDSALRSWLLGFGSAARVLAPQSLADAIAAECRRTLDEYATPK